MPSRCLRTKSLLVIVAGAGMALVAAVGCAPDTDLTDERTRDDSGAASLGPTGAGLVDPPPGAGGVPPNLAGLIIRFGAPVTVPDGGLSVCASAAGTIRSRGAALPMPCDGGGACYRVGIAGSLPPGTTCRVTLEAPLARDDGSMVAAGPVGQFDTAGAPDQSPPQLANVMTSLEAGCLGVTLTTDEPVTVEALIHLGETTTTIPVGAGMGNLDLAIPARGLAPAADGDIVIRATDRAGNGAATEAIALHTPPAAPPVVITEVLANPAGKEPVQEFVELRNIGDGTVSLEGLRLEDSRGGDVLPAVELAAGGYAVVVGAGYDHFSPVDVQPRATAALVRLDTRIGSDGLSNSGEAVRLRAAGGPDAPVISSYGGWVDVSATAWSGRSVRRAADEACDRPASWNRTPLAATPGW
jgi:hypothetical protein